MEGHRRKPRRCTAVVHGEVYGAQGRRRKIKDENKGKAGAKKQGERGGVLRYSRGLGKK